MRRAPLQLEAVGRSVGGRYVIEELLGHGGMAAVYRVRDQRSGREFALKRVIRGDLRHTARRNGLLEREFHTLSQLAHPHIIEVHDYGVDDGGPYYVMELLDGADLDRNGQLPWREACALLADVASALAMLHSRGLVHRDISGRNVRRTADGRAKLIDFGALVSIGVAKDVVGTPPFMAPEALQLQTLDARADLFALGALGYYLLTGRHAYAARTMRDLRDVWRSRPPAPARRVAEVPAALSELIMQLLTLDRASRPQRAADVLSRLCAIGGLTQEEETRVSHAYLTTPTLVGREAALVVIRKRLLCLPRGDGGCLLIEGAPGSGRSRLLDACALEGKLLGAVVLRADAADADVGEFGVIRALGSQLLELMPTQAREASRLTRGVLGQVFEELVTEETASLSLVIPERSLLVRELRDFLLAVSRTQRMVIAVDDVERIDEASLAVLASLANKVDRSPLVLSLATTDAGEETSSVLRLLRSVADRVALPELSLEDTATLMRSVFGDVANLPLIVDRVHALALGNPRTTMELAQHLVNRGSARYDAGSWSLPDALAASDLPTSLAASLAARLEGLSADARELCEAMYATDADSFGLAEYVMLTAHRDSRRVFLALDELVAARVLNADGAHYRFSQREFLEVISAGLPEARRVPLHARVATLLAQSGAPIMRRAHHLFESNNDRPALELLCSLDFIQQLPPLALLKRALESSQHHTLPVRTRFRLRIALLNKAQSVPEIDVFRHYLPAMLARLEQDSGLAAYARLADAPAELRLSKALEETQRAYLALSEHERGYPVAEAITELARLSGMCSAVALWTADLDALDSLPCLDPLVPLSPTLAILARYVEASKHWMAGRLTYAASLYEQLLGRLAEPDRAGLPEGHHARMRSGLHLMLGLIESSHGGDAVETHAKALDADRSYRVSAWRLRQNLQLSRGEIEEARKCMRRAESLQLQVGGEQHNINASFATEVVTSALANDLPTLRGAIERTAWYAARYPTLRPLLIYGQCRLRQLQGDPQGALELLLPGLELAQPARHWCFAYLAAAHVDLLTALGRIDAALAIGSRYAEICEREGLTSSNGGVRLSLGLAFLRAGMPEQAIPLVDAEIEHEGRPGHSSIALGAACEARARIAIEMRDAPAFEHNLARCRQAFGSGRNPALDARLTRLIDEAHRRSGASLLPPGELPAASQPPPTGNTEYATVHSRMRECVDLNDRARCVLTIVLQQVESFAGYLYGIRDGGLTLLAGLPFQEPEAMLEEFVRAWADEEFAALSPKTIEGGGAAGGRRERYVDNEGRSFEPVLMFTSDPGSERAAAVLMLHMHGPRRPIADRELLSHMADLLLEHGDVTGITLEQVETQG